MYITRLAPASALYIWSSSSVSINYSVIRSRGRVHSNLDDEGDGNNPDFKPSANGLKVRRWSSWKGMSAGPSEEGGCIFPKHGNGEFTFPGTGGQARHRLRSRS